MTKLLLVEDNPGDARLLREMLPSGYDVVHVERLDAAMRLVGGCDVVLLDLSLPDSHGLDTFRRLHAVAPDIAVLVLTGLSDEAGAVDAVREGAQDWLVKGHVDDAMLARALRYAVERNRLSVRLRELDGMRSLFLSVVSHDLKSPAAAILAGIDLLSGGRLGELNERQRRVLELARRNALRQTRLVDDLLAVAVIEAGAMSLHRSEVALDAMIAATLEELGPLLTERGLAVHHEPGGLTVHADADRLAQALVNLFSNAAKFATSEIWVATREGDPLTSVVVEDDGPGLEPNLVDHLFERFVRGEGERAGSGLGLSIVRGIAEAHGGTVRAENRSDRGARFILGIPRSQP